MWLVISSLNYQYLPVILTQVMQETISLYQNNRNKLIMINKIKCCHFISGVLRCTIDTGLGKEEKRRRGREETDKIDPIITFFICICCVLVVVVEELSPFLSAWKELVCGGHGSKVEV